MKITLLLLRCMIMIIDFSKLNDKDLEIAKNISKSNGSVYKTKPKNANGYEKYVWRLVGFMLASHGALACWPVTAEYDLHDYILETEDVVVYDWKNPDKGITAFDFLRNNKEYNENLKQTIHNIVDSIIGNKEMFKRNQWIGLL